MVTPNDGAGGARQSPCCCGLCAKLSQLFSPSPSKSSCLEGQALIKELLITHPLPGELKVGSYIKVTGTPIADAPWWCVNVGAGQCTHDGDSPEVVLQLTVRMPRQFTARNSRLNNVWGTPECTSLCTFPFVRNVQFVLEMVFTEEEALLAVDGVLLARYKLRTPGIDAASWLQTVGLRKPTVLVSTTASFPQVKPDYPVVPNKKTISMYHSNESEDLKPGTSGLKNLGASLGIILDKVKKKSAQDFSKITLKEKKNSVDEKKNSVDKKKNSLDEKQNSVDGKENSVDRKKKSLDRKQNSVDEDENSIEEKKNSLDGKQISVDEKQNSVDGKENSLNLKNDLVMLKEERNLSIDSVPLDIVDAMNRDRISFPGLSFDYIKAMESEPLKEPLFKTVTAPNSSRLWWGHNMCAIIPNGIPPQNQLVAKIRLRPMMHSFKIQLTDGLQEWPMANVMLEVNPRPYLRPFGSCQPIMFNSCEGGKYGTERRQCTGHMVPGTKVLLRIVRGSSEWAVWANDTLLGELDYRLPPDLVRAVRLRGDVMPLDMYVEPASATVLV